MKPHSSEVATGHRFEFGKNWNRYLTLIDDRRIAAVEESLVRMLRVDTLDGRTFVDVGSGSGIFSLAARRLGARVHSFDFDPQSVSCTQELKRRFYPDDEGWTVEEASILDGTYIERLGTFDVVYAWGVLHHTGRMWYALEKAESLVGNGGRIFVAIYNDQGSQSSRWRWIKRTYNRLPTVLRLPFTLAVIAPAELKSALLALVTLRPGAYVRSWTRYDSKRSMSKWRDIVDWVGGFPYEVAKPESIFEFFRDRHYTLITLKCGGVGLGCNEFVFSRTLSERYIDGSMNLGVSTTVRHESESILTREA